jgi:hypothetical protein
VFLVHSKPFGLISYYTPEHLKALKQPGQHQQPELFLGGAFEAFVGADNIDTHCLSGLTGEQLTPLLLEKTVTVDPESDVSSQL